MSALRAGALLALAVALWPRWTVGGALHAWAPGSPPAAGGGEGTGRGRAAEPLTVHEVASAMLLLSLALRSDSGVVEAVERVALLVPPAAAADLRTVSTALRWGVDEQAAWAVVPSAWGRAGQALRLARRAGIGPSSLLLAGARDLRCEENQRLDLAAARVGVRLVLPLGIAFLPGFCLTTVVPIVAALARQVLSS